MITTEDRKEFPKMYPKVILGIISFYVFFGIVCWMSFGNDVNTVMTTSLPEGVVATTVQLAYSVAVIFTFPLQNFPSLEIACTAISSIVAQSSSRYCCSTTPNGRFVGRILQNRNVISSILVCLLGVIAVLTMERLDKVVSLMGSLLGCPLAFCAPPLIQNQLDTSLSRRRIWHNKMVSYLGFGAMILASITTILTW